MTPAANVNTPFRRIAGAGAAAVASVFVAASGAAQSPPSTRPAQVPVMMTTGCLKAQGAGWTLEDATDPVEPPPLPGRGNRGAGAGADAASELENVGGVADGGGAPARGVGPAGQPGAAARAGGPGGERGRGAPPEPPKPASGKNRYVLIGVDPFNPVSFKDQNVQVRGLLIKATPATRLNVTSIVFAAQTCPPRPK